MRDLPRSDDPSNPLPNGRWDKKERRRDPREQEARPVYLRSVGRDVERFEEVRTMHNYSRNGFYFLTHRVMYRPGMKLYAIPSFGCFNFGYESTVVRVQELSFGEYGVAVQLMRIANLITGAGAETAADNAEPDLALV